MSRMVLPILLVCALVSTSGALEKDSHGDQEAREKAFATKLSGAVLAGSFSTDGKDSAPNKPDRYQIVSAKKLKGDDWVITSKMKVGEKEIDIPIVLKVYWADDTPIMSLTDLTIPGVGTFTARVMFHGDSYAGTWQHGEVGGQMWGKVENPAANGKQPAK
ncbi:hypothetical protein [Schlesneria sp.]|uniref:hypothetical protein n=1 Tax=Schlesneria sp. TaxID=2762018 RepID=UPI002F037067